jgi:2-polyprenyl-3-methyl-5-hydroxy-6-metoxy-1,4-benzoquinol methylase
MLAYVDRHDPAHAARLGLWISQRDEAYLAKATDFFRRYRDYIESTGRTLEYGLDCYLKLRARMVHERLEFLRSGHYANRSFAEVEKQIYSNPAAFEYHMHGLMFAQFFWPEQYTRFRFFSDHIRNELAQGGRYLEIGGGHALYILEAMSQAPWNTAFELVDISPSSMALAQGITRGLAIDFRLMNICDFAPDVKFNFITMGEVLEHVEAPLQLLVQVRNLLAPGGKTFISTPANSPTIDHIYLFNDADEIRAMLKDAGFEILREATQYADNVNAEKARKLKVALMYAAFVTPARRKKLGMTAAPLANQQHQNHSSNCQPADHGSATNGSRRKLEFHPMLPGRHDYRSQDVIGPIESGGLAINLDCPSRIPRIRQQQDTSLGSLDFRHDPTRAVTL